MATGASDSLAGSTLLSVIEGGVPYDDKPVFIGEDCWLGVNAVIMPGVTIGRGSVIGANSVVTSDIPLTPSPPVLRPAY